MNRKPAKGWIMKGYRWIYAPDGREMLEHRWIMEQYLGRKLDTDETVHHINGIKTDNRLENLEVVDRAKHTSNHRQIEPILRTCENCGSRFQRSQRFNYKVIKTCSKKCQWELTWRNRRAS